MRKATGVATSKATGRGTGLSSVGMNKAPPISGNEAPGGFTRKVYTMIRGHRFLEAIDFLEDKLISYPTSRAALSLLGFCHFQLQEFSSAAEAYERIVEFYPELEEYKSHYAQCLFKSGLTAEARKVLTGVKSDECAQQVIKLEAAIRFAEDEVAGAEHILKEVKAETVLSQINAAVILMRDEKYIKALEMLQHCQRLTPWDAHLVYNIALCYYRINEYKECDKHCDDIIARGIKSHPEFLVGTKTEGVEYQTIPNTLALQRSALVEAFNLKAALEFRQGNLQKARDCLTDLPPRKEEEIDAVTLHNQAIMNMEDNPEEGFDKLQFLISTSVFPAETFPNLIVLYMQYDLHNQAADVIAENQDVARRYLGTYLKDLFEAKALLENDPKESCRMLERILSSEGEMMRVITRRLNEITKMHDDAAKRRTLLEYEAALERYMPALTAQAKIYWDKNNYEMTYRILRKGHEFCEKTEAWRLNMGHVLYMQGNYKEAIKLYEKLLRLKGPNAKKKLLDLSAVVLGNLCVSYIMENRNKEGEVIMRMLDDAETEAEGYEVSPTPIFHLAIVNLVIGTLYCSKQNYKFGMSRIMTAFVPYQKKLGTATWTYAKRCLLSLLESMANHTLTKISMAVYSDNFMKEILTFLERIEFYGTEVAASGYSDYDGNKVGDENDEEDDRNDDGEVQTKRGSAGTAYSLFSDSSKSQGKNTVAYEARLLKALFLELTAKYVEYPIERKT